MSLSRLGLILLAAGLTPACTASGQRSALQRDSVRRIVASEVAREDSAARLFFDRRTPTAGRLRSAASISGFARDEDWRSALRIGLDPAEPPAIRIIALRLGAPAASIDSAFLPRVLTVAVTASNSDELRLAALGAIQQVSLGAPHGHPFVPAVQLTLRALLDDARPAIRARAVELLALARDTVARDRLRRGLVDSSQAIEPSAAALALLGIYPTTDVATLAQRFLGSANSQATRVVAVRLAAFEPGARDDVERIIANAAESDALRVAAGAALAAVDRSRFSDVARPIVANESERTTVRVAFIGAVRFRSGPSRSRRFPSGAMDQVLRRLARESASSAVRDAAMGYVRAKDEGKP